MTPRQFREWAGLMDEAMLLVDPGGRVVEVNHGAVALLQRFRGDLIGVSLAALIVDPPSKLTSHLRLCRRSKQFIPGSLSFRVAEQTLPCRCDGALIASEGEPLLLLRLRQKVEADTNFELLNREQHIERLGREVALRKQALAELQAERERYRVTLHSIGDGVIATDAYGGITFMNPVAEDLTGWTTTEAANADLATVFHIVNEDSRQPVANPIDRALREGTIVGLANHTILIARNGTEYAIDDSAAPIRATDGEVLGAVLVFRDITEKRGDELELLLAHGQLEERVAERARQLERANEELRQQHTKLLSANADLEQFAYIAAHDLQEPIRTIVSYLQLVEMRSGPVLDDQSKQYMETVSRSACRMREMVRAVLDYSSLGRNEAPKNHVDLSAAVDEASAQLESRIAETGATIEHGELPTVAGDSGQIVRLLQNLISNAIKFRSERPPHVRINAARDDGHWHVSVTDNGIGIRRGDAKRLFQLFQRLHPYGQYAGVGIGLASCKKIVEQHGGAIWFDEEPSGGTTFTFTLPSVEA